MRSNVEPVRGFKTNEGTDLTMNQDHDQPAVIDHIEVSHDERESLHATTAALATPGLIQELRKAEEDIKAGRTTTWSEVREDLGLADQ